MVLIIYRPDTQTTNDDMDSFLANAEDTAEKHGVHIFFDFLIREFLIIRQDFYILW